MRRLLVAALLVIGIASLGAPRPIEAAPRRPDLIPTVADLNTGTYGSGWDQYFQTATWTTASCDVREGLITPGTHRVFRFNTAVANIGDVDLKIGNPAHQRDWFVYAPCHDHYHFETFAKYRLLDQFGVEVGTGIKQGFCLEDVYVAYPDLARSDTPRYLSCKQGQGISVGWADDYGPSLSGQFIVVDDVAPGDYMLEISVNYAQVIPESDYSNNVATIPVTIT